MKNLLSKIYFFAVATVLAAAVVSCQESPQERPGSPEKQPIVLDAEINQIALTRVNDNGFCDGDVMSVYIVDYNGNRPGELLDKGNRADHLRHTYDEQNNRWNSAYDVYWKDRYTPIDIYGFYPAATPADVRQYEFSVQQDQNRPAQNGKMGGYEASDFLWGKAEQISPTQSRIILSFSHLLSSLRVELVQGEGFAAGEWEALEKLVTIRNVKQKAVIDLAGGQVSSIGTVPEQGIIPYREANAFRGIVIPQKIQAMTPLFSITVGTVSYTFAKEQEFEYIKGRLHRFSIRVDKKENTGKYSFSLAGESVTAWETDNVTHDAALKEYLVIHATPGNLEQAIRSAGKDPDKIKNLKITGEINADDFYFMRDRMGSLTALNLKETICRDLKEQDVLSPDLLEKYPELRIPDENCYIIPSRAFSSKKTLQRIILPDKLTVIGPRAFYESGLTGSLVIPEGTIHIGLEAFKMCKGLTGSLTLPSTLLCIGKGAFNGCKFNSRLLLPERLIYIGYSSFGGCSQLYGNLKLPESLEYIGEYAFSSCRNLSGSLVIPPKILSIERAAFQECRFDGRLELHNGIRKIDEYAFNSTPFTGEIFLPKELVHIGAYAFDQCRFSGGLQIPAEVSSIPELAFHDTGLSGTLELPEGVLNIGYAAFYICPGLEELVLPSSMETITEMAFGSCRGLHRIICKGTVPPYLHNKAFQGISKDQITVEVPPSAIMAYRTAKGWSDFPHIVSHHQLECRPDAATALNAASTRVLGLETEGAWEVESLPDWCSLSQNSGVSGAQVELTIAELPHGSASRTGEIIFRLKDADYRRTFKVEQFDYAHDTDKAITLQRATRGKNGGINLIFLGDGYDAREISGGKYLEHIREQADNFFSIEPYRTYREYFNVHTAIAVSAQSGISGGTATVDNRFGTALTSVAALSCNEEQVFQYVLDRFREITPEKLAECLIILVPNDASCGGHCRLWKDGRAIAFCPVTGSRWPDTRNILHREACGHGFGKLASEEVIHNTFIQDCSCTCCEHEEALREGQALGWYENVSLSGKIHEVPWKHLLEDARYATFVDIFEGGFGHGKGVYRSEYNSCMSDYTPYFNTISRESIVRRIKRYAGESFSFEEFAANDRPMLETGQAGSF